MSWFSRLLRINPDKSLEKDGSSAIEIHPISNPEMYKDIEESVKTEVVERYVRKFLDDAIDEYMERICPREKIGVHMSHPSAQKIIKESPYPEYLQARFVGRSRYAVQFILDIRMKVVCRVLTEGIIKNEIH